jgi:hypothetical protein
MAFTQAGLDQLIEAYESGALSVGHGDKRVQYGSEADLWMRIKRVSAALGLPVPGQAFRRTFGKFAKGRDL